MFIEPYSSLLFCKDSGNCKIALFQWSNLEGMGNIVQYKCTQLSKVRMVSKFFLGASFTNMV